MNPDDVGRILDEIGERIGPAGEYAWATLVGGERVMGFLGLSVGIILTVVAYVAYRLCRWAIAKHAAASSYYDSHDVAAVVFGIVGFFTAIMGLAFIGFAIPSIVAPEFVVLRNLIDGAR